MKTLSLLEVAYILYKQNINPSGYGNYDRSNTIDFLKERGFDWPMTEEKEVEFKLRFL